MLFRKKQKKKIDEENHADTACTKIEELIRRKKVDAVIVDDSLEEMNYMVDALRKRGIDCVGVLTLESAYKRIKFCDPRVIVLDFVGNEKVAHELMMQYPDKAVVCSGFVAEALDDLANKVRAVFSKNDINELAEYIKGA